MKRLLLAALVCLALGACCATDDCPCAAPPANCHSYHVKDYDWSRVRRILLLPLSNESIYPQGTYDVQDALAARLQCNGRFEVVLSTSCAPCTCDDSVRDNGCFNEQELLRLAAQHNADAVLFGTITQYVPYAPPRLGLSLRLISPGDAVVIASADGLWDARDRATADQARWYHAMVLNGNSSLLACDLVLNSPNLFRRYACSQAVEALVSPALPAPLAPMPMMGAQMPLPDGTYPSPAGPHPAAPAPLPETMTPVLPPEGAPPAAGDSAEPFPAPGLPPEPDPQLQSGPLLQ